MDDLEQLNQKISLIEQKIGYVFKDKALLQLAFIHRSFTNENKTLVKGHNERLEFLGDAILGLIVSDFLYEKLPHYAEGDLSYLRSRLVEASMCAYYVQKIEIGSFLLLGKGESMNKGKGRSTILADLFEAVMGALHLDGGMEAAQKFFFTHFLKDVLEKIKKPLRNWKAELQDFCQKTYQRPPIYQVMKEEGPDHLKIFHIIVKVGGKELGYGEGSSKKEGEQEAAQKALTELEQCPVDLKESCV